MIKFFSLTVLVFLIGLASPLSACRDGMPKDSCEQLKSTGKCNLTNVQDLCKLTCGVCQDGADDSCVNKLPEADCEGLKSSGRCVLSKVKELCPVQCGRCSGKSPSASSGVCSNQIPNVVCEALSLSGRCAYKDIRVLCPEQCGVCNGTITMDEKTSPLPTINPTQECKDNMPEFICTDLNLQGKCNLCAVQTVCPKKCGACAGMTSSCFSSEIPPSTGTGGECVDKSPTCNALAGSCDSDPMVAASCRVTCGLCPTTTAAATTTTTTTITATTTTTTTVPKPTGPPRQCHQCGTLGGAPCSNIDLLLGKAKDCPAGEQYCIVDVKIDGGKRSIHKRCANQKTCHRDWYELSSDKDSCVNYDPLDKSTTSLDCSFCCVKDNCNKSYKPDIGLLYDALN